MNRLIPAVLLIQTGALEPSLIHQALIQLPIVAVIVWLWIRDAKRRDAQEMRRDEQDKQKDERYAALVQQVVGVVERNSSAMTKLDDIIHEQLRCRWGEQH